MRVTWAQVLTTPNGGSLVLVVLVGGLVGMGLGWWAERRGYSGDGAMDIGFGLGVGVFALRLLWVAPMWGVRLVVGCVLVVCGWAVVDGVRRCRPMGE